MTSQQQAMEEMEQQPQAQAQAQSDEEVVAQPQIQPIEDDEEEGGKVALPKDLLEKLIEATKQPPQRREEDVEEQDTDVDVDVDSLSNKELINYIQSKLYKPLLQAVATAMVKMEVNEVAAKYDDFWDLKDEVYQIASSNPGMSIENAYLIAKGKRLFGSQQKSKVRELKKPQAQQPKQPQPQAQAQQQQKPQQTISKEVVTKGSGSLEDAVMRAFKEIYK